jgi:hypothetical protein
MDAAHIDAGEVLFRGLRRDLSVEAVKRLQFDLRAGGDPDRRRDVGMPAIMSLA